MSNMILDEIWRSVDSMHMDGHGVLELGCNRTSKSKKYLGGVYMCIMR